MAKRPKYHMPIEDRAKQFMPFAALRGLNEALEAKERSIASDFDTDTHLQKTGMVTRSDTSNRFLQITDTTIPFDDIDDISPDR